MVKESAIKVEYFGFKPFCILRNDNEASHIENIYRKLVRGFAGWYSILILANELSQAVKIATTIKALIWLLVKFLVSLNKKTGDSIKG